MGTAVILALLAVCTLYAASLAGHAEVHGQGQGVSEKEKDIFVYVQTIVRNPDGVLITYLESSTFTDINYRAVHAMLDLEADTGGSHTIRLDGQDRQMIKRSQTLSALEKPTVIGSTHISDTSDGVLVQIIRFAHDGFYIVPGDTVETIWTFIRPIS